MSSLYSYCVLVKHAMIDMIDVGDGFDDAGASIVGIVSLLHRCTSPIHKE